MESHFYEVEIKSRQAKRDWGRVIELALTSMCVEYRKVRRVK
jgi:hypothetical protein